MKANVLKRLYAQPNKQHKVSDFDTAYTAGINKKDAEALLAENIETLVELQDIFYAHNRYSMLLIFQAMDAAGKDGTIKHVMSGLNPQGCQVYAFKQPSAEELDHDYLWRVNKNLPERGRIGIFNRSHYEEVLVTRVHPQIILNQQLPNIKTIDDVNHEFWKMRYRQINDFERYLSENGTIVLKFFLNVSHEEQERRFIARLDDESKNWKFSLGDVEERKHWDNYMEAYSDLLTNTSTSYAPWYVIPADHKWFMRYAVGHIICDKMKALNIHYPVLSQQQKADIETAKNELKGNHKTKSKTKKK